MFSRDLFISVKIDVFERGVFEIKTSDTKNKLRVVFPGLVNPPFNIHLDKNEVRLKWIIACGYE